MNKIDKKSIVEATLTFRWNSHTGKHEENHFCRINVLTDSTLFPDKLADSLIGKQAGDRVKVLFEKGKLYDFSEKNIIEVKRNQFSPPKPYMMIEPRIGRFYPLGFFTGLAGISPTNCKPTRVMGIDNSKSLLTIDSNMPIAKYDLELNISIEKVVNKPLNMGGECKDWCSIALDNGPGMQVRLDGIETDFELDNPNSFKREDETDDTLFYKEPRITTHIDTKCHENLVELYSRIMPHKGKILDLMSSYQSHFPQNREYQIIGVGINEDEMKRNNQLNEYITCDLNSKPKLPFENEAFDAVVCDLSIDYVIRPLELISEIRRILKSNGILTFSFSNRYFPPKVIRLWVELHEFERMGYVLELLLRTGGFKDFTTYSYRGFKRPYDDKYSGSTLFSDPLYVVYAKKS